MNQPAMNQPAPKKPHTGAFVFAGVIIAPITPAAAARFVFSAMYAKNPTPP